ncbi:MAG TPA: hypothetical protein VLJ86_14870 [Ramlibacter sp.]|nr:hypothetical protein [Ramlibacter sp.]
MGENVRITFFTPPPASSTGAGKGGNKTPAGGAAGPYFRHELSTSRHEPALSTNLSDLHPRVECNPKGVSSHRMTQLQETLRQQPAQAIDILLEAMNGNQVSADELRGLLSSQISVLETPNLPQASATLLYNAAIRDEPWTSAVVTGLLEGFRIKLAGAANEHSPQSVEAYLKVLDQARGFALSDAGTATRLTEQGLRPLIAQLDLSSEPVARQFETLVNTCLGDDTSAFVKAELARKRTASANSPPDHVSTGGPMLSDAELQKITDPLERSFVKLQLELFRKLERAAADVQAEVLTVAKSAEVNEMSVRYLGAGLRQRLNNERATAWSEFVAQAKNDKDLTEERRNWLITGNDNGYFQPRRKDAMSVTQPADSGRAPAQEAPGPSELPRKAAPLFPQDEPEPVPVNVVRLSAAPRRKASEKPGALRELRDLTTRGYKIKASDLGHSGSKVLTSPGGDNYQLKLVGGISGKQFFKGDTEVCAEVIASRLARAILAVRNEGFLVPDVALIQDDKAATFGLTSKYLSNCKGNLDEFFAKQVGRPLEDRKSGAPVRAASSAAGDKDDGERSHVKVVFTRDGKVQLRNGGTIVELGEEAAMDLAAHLLDSAQLGDHDVNPGNFMVLMVEGKFRIARIDFGHAFNDLIHAVRGNSSLIGAGGQQFGNRMVDFFSRDGLMGGQSKVWRDYDGLVPSETLVKALKARAARAEKVAQAVNTELDKVLREFKQMANAWPRDDVRHNALRTSLAQLNEKIGGAEGDVSDTMTLIDRVGATIRTFVNTATQEQALAAVCELQVKVDESVRADIDGRRRDSVGAYTAAETLAKQVPAAMQQKFQWLKVVPDRPPHIGDIQSYATHRKALLLTPGGVVSTA